MSSATSAPVLSRPESRFLHFRHDGSIHHQHGLDGLRGLAVAAVVLFHTDLGIAKGGFLGVSLFFTLSGFLITSLALAEIDATGSFRLGAFWSRRFRRLLPAAWLTVAVVVAAAVATDSVAGTLRGDVWASLANVANWRFLSSGQSYASLFSGESPLLHFWSLAIEEQFYLVFPLLMWAVVSVTRRPARLLGVVVAVIAAVSFALPFTLATGLVRVYYGTDTRVGEIAVGALCAAVLSSRRVRTALLAERARRVVSVGGVVVGVGVLAAWVAMTRTWSGLAGGGLAGVALSSVVLLVAALVPGTPVNRVVSWWPLRTLGRISYAVYLFHWPALTYLTEERTGLRGPFRIAVIVAGVVALALVSERLVERPFRRGGVPRVWAMGLAAASLAVLVAVPAIVPATGGAATLAGLEQEADDYRSSLAAAAARAEADTPTTTDPATAVAGATVEAPPRPSVAMFGDSILLTIALAAGWYNTDWQYMAPGDGVLELGCGVVRGGVRRSDLAADTQKTCDEWPRTWAESVATTRPDVAVVMTCQWETVDRRYEGGEWIHVGQPDFDALIRAEFGAAIDLLHDSGTPLVLWVRCPHFSETVGVANLAPGLAESRDPARVDRLNAIAAEVVAERPGVAAMLDLAGWVDPQVDDATIRPDGSHFERTVDTGAGEVFTRMILDAYQSWWEDQNGGG